jgi:hypothetical protein
LWWKFRPEFSVKVTDCAILTKNKRYFEKRKNRKKTGWKKEENTNSVIHRENTLFFS